MQFPVIEKEIGDAVRHLVVTSGLTSAWRQLMSGLRSSDEADETAGSITRLRLVWFTSNFVHLPPRNPFENRVCHASNFLQIFNPKTHQELLLSTICAADLARKHSGSWDKEHPKCLFCGTNAQGVDDADDDDIACMYWNCQYIHVYRQHKHWVYIERVSTKVCKVLKY